MAVDPARANIEARITRTIESLADVDTHLDSPADLVIRDKEEYFLIVEYRERRKAALIKHASSSLKQD